MHESKKRSLKSVALVVDFLFFSFYNGDIQNIGN